MAQPSPPSVEGGDFRRKSEGVFKENNEDHEVVVGELQSKVTFPRTQLHGVPPYEFVRTHKKPSPAGKGDRSRWMRRTPPALVNDFLNIPPPQPPRLRAKGHLAENPSGEGVPLPSLIQLIKLPDKSQFIRQQNTTQLIPKGEKNENSTYCTRQEKGCNN